MPKEFKRYPTKNGNKYVRYYTPEGENSAFAQHNGATQRAIESKASLIAAAKVGISYGLENAEFQTWLKTPTTNSEVDTRIRLEFIKECERLALLPEKELEKLRNADSHFVGIIHSKDRNAYYKQHIFDLAHQQER